MWPTGQTAHLTGLTKPWPQWAATQFGQAGGSDYRRGVGVFLSPWGDTAGLADRGEAAKSLLPGGECFIVAAMGNIRTVAFIDANNLHRGIKRQDWKLDYQRFRLYLRDKFHVGTAFVFIGKILGDDSLYQNYTQWGYQVVYQPTAPVRQGVKDNCDGALIVYAMQGHYEKSYDQAVLVTGDGDFAPLAQFLKTKNALSGIIAPSGERCSLLLKSIYWITDLSALRHELAYRGE